MLGGSHIMDGNSMVSYHCNISCIYWDQFSNSGARWIVDCDIFLNQDHILLSMIKAVLSVARHAPLTFIPRQSFILGKLFKKRYNERQQQKEQLRQQHQKKTQTYTYDQNDKAEEEKESFEDQPDYDFFTRKKQMELNKDFRKIKEQSGFIPEELGKGGFDQVVYWSQNAKTPDQIIEITKVFNRMEIPEKVQDPFKFEQFISNLIEVVYLSSNYQQLNEFCTFGWKFNIRQTHFWQRIEEKVIRMNPSTPEDIRHCVDITFMMSSCEQGQLIYSSLKNAFQQLSLTREDVVKLLVAYCNCKYEEKEWIQQLMSQLQGQVLQLQPELLVVILPVLKEMKSVEKKTQEKVITKISQDITKYSFYDLCKISWYLGHEKGTEQFWQRLQKKTIENLKARPLNIKSLHMAIIQLLPSYHLSLDFIREYILPQIRKDDYGVLREFPPSSLSTLSKVLYIYELQKQTADIEEQIQILIIKVFNSLKNVMIWELILVIKDYCVTRNGSRQLYVFFEEVVRAKMDEIKQSKESLQTLIAIYEKSELCSFELLQELQYYE